MTACTWIQISDWLSCRSVFISTITAFDNKKGVVMDRSVVLSVGDRYKLGLGKDRIIYADMPSEKVFSTVQMK